VRSVRGGGLWWMQGSADIFVSAYRPGYGPADFTYCKSISPDPDRLQN
jgi:hypothetical protein